MSKEPYAPGHPMPSGETVTPGGYRCLACGEVLEVDGIRNLPVCPHCQGEAWEPERGALERLRAALPGSSSP